MMANVKSLVEEYLTTEETVVEARLALENAMKRRSDAVKAIFDQCGKGPFVVNGETVTISKKSFGGEKDPVTGKKTGILGTTYFFKSIGGAPVELG